MRNLLVNCPLPCSCSPRLGPRSPDNVNVNDKPSQPYVKPRRVIQAAALTPKPYLETQDDIDAYLDKLREALEQIIAVGDRIEAR